MKVTKTHVELCKTIEDLQGATYRTGTSERVGLVDDKPMGVYTQLADFDYNGFGQTARRICSFTAHLASLISVSNGGFSETGTPALVTAISEEAEGYLRPHAVAQYLNLLEQACERNNLTPPEGLVELRVRLQAESGVTNLWG